MQGSPLEQSNYTPQFSGHETFPLRYGWLKKTHDAIVEDQQAGHERSIFYDARAIAKFGVGKNMVASMRHWATQCGMAQGGGKGNDITPTALGEKLFDDNGLDPFMEIPSTAWLIHWKLASSAEKTTWFWFFNHFSGNQFERHQLVENLTKFARDRNWGISSQATIKRDVECFVRTYAARPITQKQTLEDSLECPLTELGLIKAIGKNSGFRLVRGPKPTLGDGVFIFSVLDFWNRISSAQTLSFEALAHYPGSPGRVFLLTEDALADRLSDLEEQTNGQLRWSETAGLKQLVRSEKLDLDDREEWIDQDYSNENRKVA